MSVKYAPAATMMATFSKPSITLLNDHLVLWLPRLASFTGGLHCHKRTGLGPEEFDDAVATVTVSRLSCT